MVYEKEFFDKSSIEIQLQMVYKAMAMSDLQKLRFRIETELALEIVKEALRQLLKKYKPPLPRYDHFNMGIHGVRITDRQLHRIADIRFSPEGIYCELDESENCGHIEFALTVPEIKEIIRNKRKEGWKLPDI